MRVSPTLLLTTALMLSLVCTTLGQSSDLFCSPLWECGGVCCQSGNCVEGVCECFEGWTNSTQGCDALSCPHNGSVVLHPGNQAQPSPIPPYEQWRLCECQYGWDGMACMVPTSNASCNYAASQPDSPTPHAHLYSPSNVIVDDIRFMCNITGSWNQKLKGHGTGYFRCTGVYGASPPSNVSNSCFVSINQQMCQQDQPEICAPFSNIVMKMESCIFALHSDGKMHYECAHTSASCSNKGADYLCSAFAALTLRQVSGPSSFICDLDGPDCTFLQPAVGFSIPVVCRSGQCLDFYPPIPPIPPSLPTSAVLGLVLGLIGAGIVAVALAVSLLWASGKALDSYRVARNTRQPFDSLISALAPMYASTPSPGPLVWEDLCLRLGTESTGYVLGHVSGDAVPGRVTALVGETGSGKTTLIKVLAGASVSLLSSSAIQGSISGPPDARTVLVTQFPTLLPWFTTREVLDFAIATHAPWDYTRRERAHLAELVLDAVGLAHVSDSIVGDPLSVRARGLSSGERKRLSLALGLVRGPHILIADEVSSGLDNGTAVRIMELLHSLAVGLDMAVLVTLHSPPTPVLALLDSLTVLHRGRMVFVSQPATLPSASELEDLLVEVAASTEEENLERNRETRDRVQGARADLRANHPESPAMDAPNAVEYPLRGRNVHTKSHIRPTWVSRCLGWGEDTTRVGVRMLQVAWRDPLLLRTHYGVTLGSAALLAALFYQLPLDLIGAWNRVGLLFFVPTLWVGLSTNILQAMGEWIPVFLRESRAGAYGPLSFFVAFAVLDIVPFRVFPSVMFGAIVYWSAGLQAKPDRFLTFELYLLLVSGASSAIFLLLAVLLHARPLLHSLLGSLLHLVFMLFGGFLLNANGLSSSVAWLLDVSPIDASFSAMLYNELNGVAFNFNPKAGGIPQVQLSASVLVRQFGAGDAGGWEDAVRLGWMWGVGLVGAGLVLSLVSPVAWPWPWRRSLPRGAGREGGEREDGGWTGWDGGGGGGGELTTSSLTLPLSRSEDDDNYVL